MACIEIEDHWVSNCSGSSSNRVSGQGARSQANAGWAASQCDWRRRDGHCLLDLEPRSPTPSMPLAPRNESSSSGSNTNYGGGSHLSGTAGGDDVSRNSHEEWPISPEAAAPPAWQLTTKPQSLQKPGAHLIRRRRCHASRRTRSQHRLVCDGGRSPDGAAAGRGPPGVADLLRLLALTFMAACAAQHTIMAAAQGSSSSPIPAATQESDACETPSRLSYPTMTALGCQRFEKMCIDQQQFITYDPKYNPRLTVTKAPSFDVKDVVYNWPNPWGNGDKFESGRDLHVPRVVIRVNTSEEASPDLQQPVFSRCTSPLVLWQRWMFNVGEVYETSYIRMYDEYVNGMIDPRMTLVVATPHGLRLPRFMRVFFASLFKPEVTTLAEFSDRRPNVLEPSNSTAEGRHVRCFQTVHMCKIKNRKEDGLCAAGEHLLQHYADRLPPVNPLFDPATDQDALKVVFASRPNATGRSLLNEAELIADCNALDPVAELGPSGGFEGRYRRVKCVGHVFGRDLLYDMSLAKTIDVLVATHGAAGYHSFYMSRGSSLVELIPFRFSSTWVNLYYAKMLEYEKKVFYWSIWIANSTHSHPSAFQESAVFRKEYEYREHHMTMPWAPLEHHLLEILRLGGKAMSYKAAYLAGKHAIEDNLRPVTSRPDIERAGWKHYRPRGDE